MALYIHIPFCFSKCKYCDFYSLPGSKKIPDKYVEALCHEIKFRSEENNVKEWKSVYIGGGTPSLLNFNQLNLIFSAVQTAAKITDGTEVTIEVNPDDVSELLLNDLQRTPVNRISCGIQSLNKKSLEYSGRRAGVEQNISAINLLSDVWKGEISFDLICGLPYESEASFFESLDKLTKGNANHISMYSLTIEGDTPFGKLYDSGNLELDFDKNDDLWLKSRNFLEKKGFYQYEVSNFSRTGKESIHNLTYWNHQSYLGCGCGATGTVYDCEGKAFRWVNTKSVSDYCDAWLYNKKSKDEVMQIENIDIETSKFEFFMMGLRKFSGIKESEYKKCFGCGFSDVFIKFCQKWKEKQLLEIKYSEKDLCIALNSDGILFLNKFLEDLEF